MKTWFQKGILISSIILGLSFNASLAQNYFNIDRTINDVKAFMKNLVINETGLPNWFPRVQLSWQQQTILIWNNIVSWNWKIWIWTTNPTYNVTVINWETNVPTGIKWWVKIADNELVSDADWNFNVISQKNQLNWILSIFTNPTTNLEANYTNPQLESNNNWVRINTNTHFKNTLDVQWTSNGSIDIQPWALKNWMVKEDDLDLDSINTNNIRNWAVSESKILNWQVDNSVLATDSITTDKIRNNQIDWNIIWVSQVLSDHIVDWQITNQQIAPATIWKVDINTSKVQTAIQPCPADWSDWLMVMQTVPEDTVTPGCIPKRIYGNVPPTNPTDPNNPQNPTNPACKMAWTKLNSNITLSPTWASNTIFWILMWSLVSTHVDQNWKQYSQVWKDTPSCSYNRGWLVWVVYEKDCLCVVELTKSGSPNPDSKHHDLRIVYSVSFDEQNWSVSGKSLFSANLYNTLAWLEAFATINLFTNAWWAGWVKTTLNYNLQVFDNWQRIINDTWRVYPEYVPWGFLWQFGSFRVTPYQSTKNLIPANAKNVQISPVILTSNWPMQLWSNSLDTNWIRYLAWEGPYWITANSVYVALEWAFLNTDFSWHGWHNDSTFTTSISYDTP